MDTWLLREGWLPQSWIPTRDVVRRDLVRWVDCVTGGWIMARVERESYSQRTGVHTFVLRVIAAALGTRVVPGQVIRRRGHQLYGGGVRRLLWLNEAARDPVAAEKHRRGCRARALRRDLRAG